MTIATRPCTQAAPDRTDLSGASLDADERSAFALLRAQLVADSPRLRESGPTGDARAGSGGAGDVRRRSRGAPTLRSTHRPAACAPAPRYEAASRPIARLTRRGRLAITVGCVLGIAAVTAIAYLSAGSATVAGGAPIAGGVAPASVSAAESLNSAAVTADDAHQAYPGAASRSDLHVVQAGETLWQIARTVRPSADPAATVRQIRALSQLPGGAVHPGQTLRLPS